MGSATASFAPDIIAAALAAVTHWALWKPAGEQANADGYARQAMPTMTASGDADEESTAVIEFTASGAAWTGPWYLVGTNSGTYGAGNQVVIAVNASTKAVQTLRDSGGTEITALADGSSLKIPIGSLEFVVPTAAVPAP